VLSCPQGQSRARTRFICAGVERAERAHQQLALYDSRIGLGRPNSRCARKLTATKNASTRVALSEIRLITTHYLSSEPGLPDHVLMIRKIETLPRKEATVMLRRIGMLALMLSATGVALMPKVASAQEGYYALGDNHYRSDRRADRLERKEWRGRERSDRRSEEWRERAARDRGWRGNEHWTDSYRYDYRRDPYCGPYSWR